MFPRIHRVRAWRESPSTDECVGTRLESLANQRLHFTSLRAENEAFVVLMKRNSCYV